MKRILAIASGKGGVGKTWFSICLGQAFAQMNRRVLLVDCDVGLANIDVQLGLDQKVDMNHVVTGEFSLSQAIRPVARLGLDVMPGRSRGGWLGGLEPSVASLITDALRHLDLDYDLIVLDLPSGIDPGVRELMRIADEEIIVTTSEPTALTDAYALIKATNRARSGGAPSLVLNFAKSEEAGHQTLEGLVRVCDRFLKIRPKQLGVIRQDPRVSESISRQTPLLLCYPCCDAARDVIATARDYLSVTDPS